MVAVATIVTNGGAYLFNFACIRYLGSAVYGDVAAILALTALVTLPLGSGPARASSRGRADPFGRSGGTASPAVDTPRVHRSNGPPGPRDRADRPAAGRAEHPVASRTCLRARRDRRLSGRGGALRSAAGLPSLSRSRRYARLGRNRTPRPGRAGAAPGSWRSRRSGREHGRRDPRRLHRLVGASGSLGLREARGGSHARPAADGGHAGRLPCVRLAHQCRHSARQLFPRRLNSRCLRRRRPRG